MDTPDVVVVGAGVIGLAVGWRAAAAGLTVAVLDPTPTGGASHAAAGMLAPVTEVHYGEERLLALNLASAARYPTFVAELEAAAGVTVGYRTEGTLAVALDAGDRAVLAELHAFQTRLGLRTELLTSRDCRLLEPLLSPSVRGGLFVAGDHSVDNRRLAAALLAAAERAGVVVRRSRAVELVVDAVRVRGVRLADGSTVAADTVVLAAGCWSGSLAGIPPGLLPPVRPVKGQILRLAPGPGGAAGPRRTVRGVVAGGHVYLVPRADGELVVGASVEEQGFDTTVTVGGVYELLRDAQALLPGLSELALVESTAGLRPGTPDNAPLIGRTDLEGLLLATGHYRNGILLVPVTAEAVTAMLTSGNTPPVVAPFDPRRFAAAGAPR